MIIDFHTHIGKIINKSEDDLLYSMDRAKIDKSVIFAGDVCGLTNNELIDILDKHPNSDRFLGVIAVYPHNFCYMNNGVDLSVLSQMEMAVYYQLLKHPKIIGVKFYTGYHHYYANDDKVYKILKVVKGLNKIAIFHTGDTYNISKTAKLKYAQPLTIDEIAVDFPDLKIVIAHMGYPWHRDTAEVLYKNENVYTDVSGFVYGNFKNKDITNLQKVLKEIEMVYDNNWDRFLFGTDWPISNQNAYCSVLGENLGLLKTFNTNTVKLIDTILNK